MYEQIIKKLGFNPKDYNEIQKEKNKGKVYTEDDSQPNPFDILTLEELEYLSAHNYFRDGKPLDE